MTTDTSGVDARVESLLGRLGLRERAALMFHPVLTIGPGGSIADFDPRADRPGARELIVERGLSHFNVVGTASAGDLARWHNALQDLAGATASGMPVTLSSDPRHAFADNPGTAIPAGAFSQWPEPLGFGALRDADAAYEFGCAVRREYSAVGIRVALHPQLDLATEPRWARLNGTYGDDPALVGEIAASYIHGLQGNRFGVGSVAAMVKHFPGGGPQKDGEDPHFAYGREQVYPTHNWEAHLAPFRQALDAGARQVMPYYGMPIGSPWDEVGFGFNRPVIEGLLRKELGFDGIVCADWGIISDSTFLGHPFPARAWGVEHLSPIDRMHRALDAGVDQFGGEACPELIVELVETGRVGAERIDASARRVLREKVLLGLFDEERYVDPGHAQEVVGSPDLVAAGRRAQSRAVTLLKNSPADACAARPTLPLDRDARLFVQGLDPEVAAAYAHVVSDPEQADYAIVRLQSPYDPRGIGTFEEFFHTGRLHFDEETVQSLRRIAAVTRLVAVVHLERPPILGDITELAYALAFDYGSSDAALLDALFGTVKPVGRLPVGLPKSVQAVERHPSDAPLQGEEVLYPRGAGLDV
ncbi:glycoside hydrolase family 3 N-terminal domain-containing protein [Streptomyces sp. NPDC001508]|uniref:glycoside hydrolase family 3 protein n=1 Tax=Streptomyces sp. NPDC001508 TaxID=3154656 RepID=UPI003316EF2B